MKKKIASLMLALCCAFAVCGCNQEPSKPEHLGLYAAEDGTMMKDGKPFYGIGVNYYSMMEGCYDKNYRLDKVLSSLETLASYDVRVVRFNLTGIYTALYWYEFVTTENLEKKFFERLDVVVKKAEELEIGLIPSFAWNSPALSDAFNEPSNKAFAEQDSKTMIWFLDFTKRVVKRYVDSPAIYGWEYGNEQNLSCSLPVESRGALGLGTPLQKFGEDSRPKRTEDDYMTYATHKKSIEYFAEAVYNTDPYHRIIGSGDAAQRNCIWHWVHDESGLDTLEQFEEMLDMTVSGYASAVSVHEYAHSDSGTGSKADASLDGSHVFGSTDFVDYFTKYLAEGARAKKAVYMGETGYLSILPGTRDQWNKKDEAHSIKVTEAILSAAYETDFPLTLLWVYDDRSTYDGENHTQHDGGTEHSWNENYVKGKAYLEAVKKYNKMFDDKHAENAAE